MDGREWDRDKRSPPEMAVGLLHFQRSAKLETFERRDGDDFTTLVERHFLGGNTRFHPLLSRPCTGLLEHFDEKILPTKLLF